MTIISICFIVMLNALGLNIRNTSISEGYITACLLAKTRILEIMSKEQLEEGTEDGNFDNEYPNYEWMENIEILKNYKNDDNLTFFDDMEEENSEENSLKDEKTEEHKVLFKVNLTVKFKEAGQVRSVNYETIVSASEKVDI